MKTKTKTKPHVMARRGLGGVYCMDWPGGYMGKAFEDKDFHKYVQGLRLRIGARAVPCRVHVNPCAPGPDDLLVCRGRLGYHFGTLKSNLHLDRGGDISYETGEDVWFVFVETIETLTRLRMRIGEGPVRVKQRTLERTVEVT